MKLVFDLVYFIIILVYLLLITIIKLSLITETINSTLAMIYCDNHALGTFITRDKI